MVRGTKIKARHRGYHLKKSGTNGCYEGEKTTENPVRKRGGR